MDQASGSRMKLNQGIIIGIRDAQMQRRWELVEIETGRLRGFDEARGLGLAYSTGGLGMAPMARNRFCLGRTLAIFFPYR